MSEVKHNVWFDPLPDYLKSGPLVFVVTWKAPAKNHAELQAAVAEGMNVQRQTPASSIYSRTRHWYMPCDDGVNEQWWFMDEYDSPDAFEAMQRRTRHLFTGETAAKTAKRHAYLLSLMAPDTDLSPVLYSEVPGSRIEFEPYAARAQVIEQQIPGEAE